MRIPIECEIKDCNDTQEFEQVQKFQSGGKTSTLMTETFVLWIKMKTC